MVWPKGTVSFELDIRSYRDGAQLTAYLDGQSLGSQALSPTTALMNITPRFFLNHPSVTPDVSQSQIATPKDLKLLQVGKHEAFITWQAGRNNPVSEQQLPVCFEVWQGGKWVGATSASFIHLKGLRSAQKTWFVVRQIASDGRRSLASARLFVQTLSRQANNLTVIMPSLQAKYTVENVDEDSSNIRGYRLTISANRHFLSGSQTTILRTTATHVWLSQTNLLTNKAEQRQWMKVELIDDDGRVRGKQVLELK